MNREARRAFKNWGGLGRRPFATLFDPPPHVVNVPAGRSVTLYNTYFPYTDGRCTRAYALRHDDGMRIRDIAFGPRERYRMTNSCDGLVGVYGCNDFWIANPSIPRLAALPRCSPHVSRFNPSHNSYHHDMPHPAIGLVDAVGTSQQLQHKVVRIYTRDNAGAHRPVSLGCEVLTLEQEGRHRFWKAVDDPPELTISMFSMPVVVDGTVYWTVRTASESAACKKKMIRSKLKRSAILLCFDLLEDKFSLVDHPLGWDRGRGQKWMCSRLFLVGGRPCLVDYQRKGMTLWRLEDRESSEWLRLHHFDFTKKKNKRIQPKWDLYRPLYWKFYYDLQASTADQDIDEPTLRLLDGETRKEAFYEGYTEDVDICLSYIAPYAGTDVWPF